MADWSLETLLHSLHDDIHRQLETAREAFKHPGTKGDASEKVWLELLQKYLPERYRAEKAHIVYSQGNFSYQIDVVIFDRQYTIGQPGPNPHRPFSAAELKKREQIVTYLNSASEDKLIEEILLPLFRQLGFQRITATGHKDKALEFGKDIWMKFVLPTLYVLYFGIQVKKDKLDAAGASKGTNVNVAEIYNQVTMMLGHEIFDPEIGKRVLVDHAFIIAGGEITKAARLWIGNKLDASKRSQIMFMDREDIINLFVVTKLGIPNTGALSSKLSSSISDDLLF